MSISEDVSPSPPTHTYTRITSNFIELTPLRTAFTKRLEAEGWQVDTDLEDLSAFEKPLEEFPGSNEDREAEILRRLKSIGEDTHRALILKISHIGGHKFAGNVIVSLVFLA